MTDKLPASIASDPSEAVSLAPPPTTATAEDETGRKRKEVPKDDNELFHQFTSTDVVLDSAPSVEPPPKKHATIYRCDVVDCGKVFGKKFNLKAHKRVHTGEEPFKCSFPLCNKTFKWQSSLSYHEGLHLSNSIDTKDLPLAAGAAAANSLSQPDTEDVVENVAEKVTENVGVSQATPVVVPPETVVVPHSDAIASHPEPHELKTENETTSVENVISQPERD